MDVILCLLARSGIPVDKMTHMVGSYAPKHEAYSYLTPTEDAPSGLIKRGTYHVTSLFTDDDKNEHLKWEWSIDIKKDWD
jgi:Rho GDP-dissociation inhibitor